MPLTNLVHRSQKVCATVLAVSLAASMTLQPLMVSAAPSEFLTGEVNISVKPSQVIKSVNIQGGEEIVNISFRDVAVGDALRALGRKGGFNVVINDSVQGSLSVDLNNVTIREALEAIKTQSDLTYATRGGDTLMVSTAESIRGQELQRTHSEVLPLKFANATVVAQILNTSVFAPASQDQIAGNTGGQIFQKIVADFRTNSLIVVGTPSDIQTAREYVEVLDVPRESKTWRLSHANAVDVASILTSSVFNEGVPTLQFQSGGAGGGGGGGGGAGGGAGGGLGGGQQIGTLPSSLRVQIEEITEGEGATTTSSVAGGSVSQSGGGLTGDITIRDVSKTEEIVQVLPNGAIVMPDSRLNTVTVFGTVEQIGLAEKMITTLDRRAPQVVIETMLIEVTESAVKELTFNTAGDGLKGSFATNNLRQTPQRIPFTLVGVPSEVTNPFESLFRWSTNSGTGTAREFFYQINALVSNQRAKILANPTVVTLHDKEAIVSIVDEIIESVTVTFDTVGAGAAIGSETNIGDVGIVLNILPKIAPNGMIQMRVRPTLSTIASVQEDVRGNVITLLTKREALAQNIMLHDGQSFVLGGLLQETDVNEVNKVPMLADLPIVGALLRSSERDKEKSELIIVITPHIINDDYNRTAESTESASANPVNFQAVAVDGNKNFFPAVRGITPLVAPPGEAQPISRQAKDDGKFLPAVKEAQSLPPEPKAGSQAVSRPAPPRQVSPQKPPAEAAAPPRNTRPSEVQPRLTPAATTPTIRPAATVAPVQPKAQTPQAGGVDTSDEAIRKIIERFAPMFDPSKDSY